MAMPNDAGWALAVSLLLASRALFDQLHERLDAAGHPDLRPAHGFVFQAVGSEGATPSEISATLGVTKQAARLIVAELVEMKYLAYGVDQTDARRRPVHLTDRGREALSTSAAIFERLRDEIRADTGDRELQSAMAVLRAIESRYGSGGLRPVW
jgi:DNA-binding MarR family transcriptional regulator